MVWNIDRGKFYRPFYLVNCYLLTQPSCEVRQSVECDNAWNGTGHSFRGRIPAGRRRGVHACKYIFLC
jgi:hypothetical protein